MATPEQLACLREFGLSDSQSRAYVALLELRKSDAREVSRQSKVPLTRLYQVLEQLKERGLVVVHPSQPRAYEPLAMDAFLLALRDQRVEEARALERRREEIAALFPVAATVDADDRGEVLLVRGRFALVDKLRHAVQAAREEILYLAPAGTMKRGVVLPLLEEATQRGLDLRVILPSAPHWQEIIAAASARLQVHARPDANGAGPESTGVLVIDGRLALLLHFVPDDASHRQGKDVTLVVQEHALVQTLRTLLLHVWATTQRLAPEPFGR